MKFTVLGSRGLLGSHLVVHLRKTGESVFTPARGDSSIFQDNLGHVIYCIGVTTDFRRKPFETVEAHVCYLAQILKKAQFDSLLYLSSTRVYYGADCGHEDAKLQVNPQNPDYLYNISKIMGESICLAIDHPSVRIVRLSNLFGRELSSSEFLQSIIRQAVHQNRIILKSVLNSEKDYVNVDDVVPLLPQIARSGRFRLYNIASGTNVSHGDLIDSIRKMTGCSSDIMDGAVEVSYPKISVERIREEFGFSPISLFKYLESWICECKDQSLKSLKRKPRPNGCR